MKNMLKTATVTTGATVLALTLALTGCGNKKAEPPVDGNSHGGTNNPQSAPKQGPTGSEALAAAKRNLQDLKTVTLKGHVEEDGENMQVEATGSVQDTGDYSMSMDGLFDGQQNSMTVLSIGDKVYLKGSEGFYKSSLGDSSGKMAEAIGDKFLELPSEQADSMKDMSFKSLMDSTFGETIEDDALEDPSAKGKLTTFKGQKVYAYEGEKGSDESTMYLTADGKEQFAGMASSEVGELSLTDHNKDIKIDAPSSDKIMTMDQLQQAAQG